jgi:lambda family phage portal protein
MAKKKKQQRKRVAPSRPPKTAKKFVRRSYDGAEYSRLWKDWITGSTSANNELYSILPTLRDRCRDLARNDPYANGALRLICDNVLGESGFTFQAKVPLLRGQGFNDGANQQIEALFHHWARRENCDVRGLSDFTQLERLILRTWAESGEVLIREVYQPFGSSKIPYALQVLEPDYLAEDLTIQLKNSTSRVEMGVQIDPMGRREGYWIYKGHPGDRRTTAQVNRYEVEFVPAAEMHHLFICDRPGQLRGVPWLAVAIKRLHFLADTEDAELVAAKLSAFVGGVIKSLEPDSFTDSVQDSEHATEGQPGQFREFEPGMFLKLFPDEDFQSFSNNRPNQALPDFTKHILRGISAGVGLSYSGVSNDFSDASYSSHRAEKLKEIRSTRFLQNEFKSQFHNPITRKVIEWGWLKGKLDLAQYELYEERYQKFNWGSPSFDWIDPSKDIAAAVQAIESGLSTYTIELSKLNRDFEEIVAERSREKDMLEAAGLIEQPAPPDEGNEVQEGLTAIRRQLESFSQNDYQPLIQLLATRSLEPVTVEAIEAEDELAFGMVRSHEVQRKAKNCKKGKPCRNSCISKSKVCLADLSPEQKKLAIQARRAMKAGGGVSNDVAFPPTSSESADFAALKAAIAAGDFDAMIDPVNAIYDRGKAQAQKDGVNFYTSIQGGNGTTDPLTTAVLTEAGFNGLPQQVSKADLDNIDRVENLVFYRNPSSSNFNQRFDQFKNGDGAEYTSGRGIYCSGTYVAADYTGGDGMSALGAAQGYGNGTMRMAINRADASIVKATDLSNEQGKFRRDLDKWYRAERAKLPVDQNLKNQKIVELNSGKISVTGKKTIFNGASTYDIESVDPTTKKRTRISPSLWKDTSMSAPWYIEDDGNFSRSFKTRKEAINWAIEREAEKQSINDRDLRRTRKRIRNTIIGDDAGGASGRFAVFSGHDFVELDNAYDPTYGLMLNRSKVKVQATKASSTKP